MVDWEVNGSKGGKEEGRGEERNSIRLISPGSSLETPGSPDDSVIYLPKIWRISGTHPFSVFSRRSSLYRHILKHTLPTNIVNKTLMP